MSEAEIELPPEMEMDTEVRRASGSRQSRRSRGRLAGGYEIVLTGFGFQAGAEVFFGDAASTAVNVDSSTTARAIVPAASDTGIVSVTIVNPSGASTTLDGGFTYITIAKGDQTLKRFTACAIRPAAVWPRHLMKSHRHPKSASRSGKRLFRRAKK